MVYIVHILYRSSGEFDEVTIDDATDRMDAIRKARLWTTEPIYITSVEEEGE